MLNKMTATLATTAFVLGASTAVAQSIPFAEVDTDSDMMLSNEELVAAFGEDGAAILMADDADGDGMLSVQEIRVATDMGASDMDETLDPEDRAESDDSDDPDYRDEDEDPIQPNDTETEGFLEEGEDTMGEGDEDDGQ
ncbi:hypothetical protein [Limimaricola hongkongensis]|uniref:EF-hand domain-containing protein n=1 Tax=Limimaricola hongkongensis DSM 17492 TaxID=1122180 RepID=A0A017H930_9RHOB|nr:hypothetical protein [Limimaricola hongkongensis]EYD70825.1 hypothetical protein Lokhon_02467 [Limimaricola hongkongensis DSM 17492]